MCGFLAYQGKKESFTGSFEQALNLIKHRGPDQTQIVELPKATLGFHRLAIMDLSQDGAQPFEFGDWVFMCNGEIYNYQELLQKLPEFRPHSQSDCEVLGPMLDQFPLQELYDHLDGEFAMVAYHRTQNYFIALRDPLGIRPLFWGRDQQGRLGFASEAKALQAHFHEITPFPPGHFFDGKNLTHALGKDFYQTSSFDTSLLAQYWNQQTQMPTPAMDQLVKPIRDQLTAAVIKRLHSDAPLGALLSGGLDSSLVCSIAMKHLKTHHRAPLKTFAIGMDKDPIDLRYARAVADAIGSEHSEIIITRQDILKALREVIWHLESWDITTVRASIGMYLICQRIKEQTDIKVLLTGEVSDELFGYKYTDYAPDAQGFQAEAMKRVRELYTYDVLRADRCIAAASLEARVPFSDKFFVKTIMNLPAELKRNHYQCGKYLLRQAFAQGDYLPHDLLMREKAAFSDAVGHSLVDTLKEYAAEIYTAQDLIRAQSKYQHGTPFTLESLLYRDIFEEFYPQQGPWIPDFWMPNKEWKNCNVDDPSARVLPNYGLSGH